MPRCLVLLAGALLACAHGRRSLSYPPAPRADVFDDYAGVKVADPYRPLEDIDAPATRAWVVAEAKLAESALARIPARAALEQRIRELSDYERFGLPFHEGERYFYAHNRGLQDQSVLYLTDGIDGAPAVALDPNTLSADGSLAVVGHVPSRDGKLLAYGVSKAGSDWTEWRVRDLASGKDLPDVLPHTKYYPPVWDAAGKGLYYSRFPAPAPGEELAARDLGNTLRYHALGTPVDSDPAIYQRQDHPDWQFSPAITDDGRWLVITAGEGQVGDKGLVNVYLADLAAPAPAVVPVAEGFDANYFLAGADGGWLFFQTTLDAPRGRVIAIDPRAPARSRWREIVPQGPDTMDVASGSVTLVGHQLIVSTQHDVHTQVTAYGLDGQRRRDVAMPGVGVAHGFAGKTGDRETFFIFMSMITPPTIYRLDLETGASAVFRAPKMRFDPAELETREEFYPARDGTRIPIFLAYRKGLVRDGSHPTILYGYGGFGISALPYFSAGRVAWLERGGVFAVANIRGGGEYGEEWHRPAMRTHRQLVFDDFIDGAEWLIAQRYTSTPKLAIQGGSNGGLLVTACLTQRPDLFGAVVADVAVTDMLRFSLWGQGAGWEGEYGSPSVPEELAALRAYSPYHNVRPGTRYPATLIVTGDHDTRVFPAHSFKLAAALQAAQAGPAPILLRVQLSSGHGGGTTLRQKIGQIADEYAFLLENL